MHYDVIIIGGSFAGLAAAMQLVRARRKVLVIDANLPRNRFSAHSHGVFGLDGKSPKQIRSLALEQLFAYPTFNLLEDTVETANRGSDEFEVKTSSTQLTSQRLILAMGVKDVLPPIEGLSQYWGKNAVHCPYCHGYELSERQLGVLATSDMSLHQAAMLPDWGTVTLFTQNQFTPDDTLGEVLNSRGVKIENTSIVKVLGDNHELNSVMLDNNKIISLGGLYVVPRIETKSRIIENLALTLTASPLGDIVAVDAFKESSHKGVFVAGDLSNPMQNGALAATSGTLAGIGAHRSLVFDTLTTD